MTSESGRVSVHAVRAQGEWAPYFGALPEQDGTRFRTFVPPAGSLRLELLTGAAVGMHEPSRISGGIAEFFVRRAGAGDRYAYVLDGSARRPDPASRFQPDGVHEPSQVVDPAAYRWRHLSHGPAARDLVIYELHVGTFTPEGTFAAARRRLTALRDLGITAIELMPLADFAGTRNWGYDGVCLYAPSRNYGHPDDLRALVDAAHGLGLGVILDVVYNHLGPEGAYLPQFCPSYITERHQTPWGGAINLDDTGSGLVRRFIIDNAISWLTEYQLDGLRLDATHALIDSSDTHIIADLATAVRRTIPWPVVLHAEDARNDATLIEDTRQGGWGLDGVWADDFHHVMRRKLAGDAHSYYRDYRGTVDELARTIRQGWLFTGQHSEHQQQRRGTDPSRLPMQRFVVCLENHDQVGNRAAGDRLNHAIDAAAWRAASTLLLTLPMTPLLFMGQEWAASAPFQFFTDLEASLGERVTAGRADEFKDSPGFSDPGFRERIPDPQAKATFERSRLDWTERDREPHRQVLALYTELLRLRRTLPSLAASPATEGRAEVADDDTVVMVREGFTVVVRLAGAGTVRIERLAQAPPPRLLLSTEDPRFAPNPAPIAVEVTPQHVGVSFLRPGAVIFQW